MSTTSPTHAIAVFVDQCRARRIFFGAHRGVVTDFFIEVDLDGALSEDMVGKLFADMRVGLSSLSDSAGTRITLVTPAFSRDESVGKVHLDFALRISGDAERSPSLAMTATAQAMWIANEAAERCSSSTGEQH